MLHEAALQVWHIRNAQAARQVCHTALLKLNSLRITRSVDRYRRECVAFFS